MTDSERVEALLERLDVDDVPVLDIALLAIALCRRTGMSINDIEVTGHMLAETYDTYGAQTIREAASMIPRRNAR